MATATTSPHIDAAIRLLKDSPICGYGIQSSETSADYSAVLSLLEATEPTAFAALALHAYGEVEAATAAADWLAATQDSDGFLGITESEPTPRWPTSLAIIAWTTLNATREGRYTKNIERACRALLSIKGQKIEPSPDLGHDTQLVGWPWVDGTHSWVEPTCLAVMALKAAGHSDHPRVREAVALLRDRQIRGAGWNCGNTVVLGQTQATHVQPTGMALLALIGEEDPTHRNDAALRYLLDELHQGTGATSTCWAWLALAAHRGEPNDLANELAMTTKHVLDTDRSPYKLALLALASLGEQSPLLPL